MPMMPLHWGPVSAAGFARRRWFDLPTLLLAAVILDVEPMLASALGRDDLLHGITHTFVVGGMIAAALAAVMYRLRGSVRKVMRRLHLAQEASFAKTVWSALAGVYSHVLLDAPLYTDIRPFWPSQRNPLYGAVSVEAVYWFCFLTLVVGVALYGVRLVRVSRGSDLEKDG